MSRFTTRSLGNSNNLGDDSDYKFGNRSAADEEKLQRIHERIGQVENESLESTQRTLRTLNETREIGVKTAEELVRQGEKLEGINNKLDDVDNTLDATQKNINQIKSIFGGFKNKFFGGGNNTKKSSSTSSFDKQSNKMSSSSSASSGLASGGNIGTANRERPAVISGSDREKEINSNLEEMSLGLSHLTNLAKDMQFELDRQNPIIDKLNEKTVKTQYKMEDQNTQMRRVLK